MVIVSSLGFPNTSSEGSHWQQQQKLGVDHIPSNDRAAAGFDAQNMTALDGFVAARALGIHTRPVLASPISEDLAGKRLPSERRAALGLMLRRLQSLADAGADWVQIDEPCLTAGPLARATRTALHETYEAIAAATPLKILVNAGTDPFGDNRAFVLALPIAGLHFNCAEKGGEFADVIVDAPATLYLSLGIVDGRHEGAADLITLLDRLEPAAFQRGLALSAATNMNPWPTDLGPVLQDSDRLAVQKGLERFILAPTCSLAALTPEAALTRLNELTLLRRALTQGRAAVGKALRRGSPRKVVPLALARATRTAA